MTDYLCSSLAWSILWAAVGFILGVLIADPVKRATRTVIATWRQPLTTPEKFRRRQRLEGIGLIILGLFSVVTVFTSEARDDSQDACFRTFLADQSNTQKLRSGLVEQESDATRKVIASALSAGSRAEIEDARNEYLASLTEIDEARAENPVVELDPDLCDS